MFNPWPFLGFVSCASPEKLNPVFNPIFCKEKDHLVELITRDALLFRFPPKLIFQGIAVGHVVINIRPHHECRVASCGKHYFSQLLWKQTD